jgi:hypothetical protein
MCGLVGESINEPSDSLLWKGGVGGRCRADELPDPNENPKRERCRLAWSLLLGGEDATKNGLEIVVTRIACFNNALSEVLLGRKLIKPSNGR